MLILTRTEIKERLLSFRNSWISVAFATRITTLSLPGLAGGMDENKPFLWYWQEENKAEYYLTFLLLSWQRAWASARCQDRTPHHLLNKCNSSRNVATKHNAFAAAAASLSIARAVDTNADRIAVRAAGAAASAAYAAARAYTDEITSESVRQEATNYIYYLQENRDIDKFLEKPFSILDPSFERQKEQFLSELNRMGNGFDYWAEWYNARLAGKPLDITLLKKIINISGEILDKKPSGINAYLQNLQSKKILAPLNRVRAIFIGFAAAGKTSIIRTLNNEPVVEGTEQPTPGIDIRHWSIPPNNLIQADLWDFGGQVIFHATHQFFLRERCLYVLVLDSEDIKRRNRDIDANEHAEYWLEYVRAFGGDSRVLIVGNKIDRASINLNMTYLKNKYPNIINFYPLSCTQSTGQYKPEFERFCRDFEIQLQLVGTNNILLEKSHFEVLKKVEIESRRETFLSRDKFLELCRIHSVNEHGSLDQEWLLDLLDKLGIVIHFPKLSWLNSYLLNPRWLTYGVYSLLFSKIARQQKGYISVQTAIEILNQRLIDEQGCALEYKPEHSRFILDALELFEIAFRLPNKTQQMMIPALLPSDTPKIFFDKADSLSFDFDFRNLLPKHILPGFIVRRHREIVEGAIWQNGVHLRSLTIKAEALVQADYRNRKLSLNIKGEDASTYFKILYDDIKQMLDRMPDLPYEEFVGLPEEARIAYPKASLSTIHNPRVDFQDLKEKEFDHEYKLICKFGTYNIKKIYGIIHGTPRKHNNSNRGVMSKTQDDKTENINSRKDVPMSEKYIDFDLHIDPNGHAVASSPEGQVVCQIPVKPSNNIRLSLQLIEQRQTNAELLKDVGKAMYDWLFENSIHTHLQQTEAVARRDNAKVRLRLRIESSEIASLPLEFIYRETGGYFLAVNPDTVFSRYLNLPLPPERVRRREGSLHMLAIIADPADQVRLDPDEWESVIKEATAKPLADKQMTLHTIKRATRKEIRNALLEQKPDIIQFIGHGTYQNGKGFLALVDDDNGKTWPLDDERFANLFLGHADYLGLFVMATCESAKSDDPRSFLGIAPQLVQRGTSAVVAMQYAVYVKTAKIFLEDFYTSVAAHKPIDWSVQSARNAVSLEYGLDNREFATPVLYMRAQDGNVF